jgi:hypothetical protein
MPIDTLKVKLIEKGYKHYKTKVEEDGTTYYSFQHNKSKDFFSINIISYRDASKKQHSVKTIFFAQQDNNKHKVLLNELKGLKLQSELLLSPENGITFTDGRYETIFKKKDKAAGEYFYLVSCTYNN